VNESEVVSENAPPETVKFEKSRKSANVRLASGVTLMVASGSVIGLNVTNQVHLIKLVLRDMLARGEGKILITASLIALSPGPFMAIYAATKAFLHSFGLSIRNELQETPIVVTVLMPGATESEFWERADMEDTNVGRSKKEIRRMSPRKPSRRLKRNRPTSSAALPTK